MSQVQAASFCSLLQASISEVEAVECGAEGRLKGRSLRHNVGEFGAEQLGIGSGEEDRNAQTARREPITVAMRKALDDAVQAEV